MPNLAGEEIATRAPADVRRSNEPAQLSQAAGNLKRFWWNLRAEAQGLALWLLASVPLQTGAWLRARLMRRYFKHMGPSVSIQAGLRLTNPEEIEVGDNCAFGQGVFLTGGGGIRLGNWVGLGPDVKVWSVTHSYSDHNRPWMLQGWHKEAVVIEDDVWIGASSFVMPGVTIGRGAIISACTVVNRSIPPYALVAGNPCRIFGWRRPQQPQGVDLRNGSAACDFAPEKPSSVCSAGPAAEIGVPLKS